MSERASSGSYGIITWREGDRFRILRTKTEQEHYECLTEILFGGSGNLTLLRSWVL
jgi:hypothetical protein